jgi:hypothetical protein
MNQKIKRHWLIGIVTALVLSGVGTVARASDDVTVRWDLLKVVPPNLYAGGVASPSAGDGSTITVTGSGTFQISEGSFEEATGGGTWETRDASNVVTGSGTYRVRGVVLFMRAPGSLPSPPLVDHIGNAADASSGLAVLRVHYSDGSRGILVVECMLPVGSPPSFVEGITVIKGNLNYLNSSHSPTLFHVQAAHESN